MVCSWAERPRKPDLLRTWLELQTSSQCKKEKERDREKEGPLKNAECSRLWRTMHVALIGALHSDTPLPSQHSHAALTQRVAVNLAWRKHGFKVNEGSDVATPLGGEQGSTGQTEWHHKNIKITERQHVMVRTQEEQEIKKMSVGAEMFPGTRATGEYSMFCQLLRP